MRPATKLIHTGESEPGHPTPLTTPVYETTTFVFESAEEVRAFNEGRSSKYLYSRYSNPTIVSAEQKVAALDHAESALLFASGMAATSTILMTLAGGGDEVICGAAIYGGTLHLLADLLTRFGVTPRFVSIEDLSAPERLFTPKTKVLWFESPINPTLRCVDVGKIAAACREHHVTSVLDNTFASPINQQPLALGVDLVMQSATKYLNGHSDVTAGAVAGPKTLIDRIEKTRRLLGTVTDPAPAYALARGMKTLAVRMARHNQNAQAVAEFLAQDRRVSHVYYPGLRTHPDHAIACGQMSGFGGMVCVDLGGSFERVSRFFDRLRLFKRAVSLGGVESLISLPVLTSQWGHTDAQLEEAGITRGMARLSIGLEDAEDLIEDVDQALA